MLLTSSLLDMHKFLLYSQINELLLRERKTDARLYKHSQIGIQRSFSVTEKLMWSISRRPSEIEQWFLLRLVVWSSGRALVFGRCAFRCPALDL